MRLDLSLGELREVASRHPAGMIDLSIGNPVDAPPAFVPHILATSNLERGYPPSVGSLDLRRAVGEWVLRSFGVSVGLDQVAATIGSKEFIASAVLLLKAARPERSVVLVPSSAYPTYSDGAALAGCEVVRVPEAPDGRPRLETIADSVADVALALWVNSPSNPTGAVYGLGDIVSFGARHDVVVLSDECYSDFVWSGDRESVLNHATRGVVAVFSLSKRSNLAGLRIGAIVGDPELVGMLADARRRFGLMPAGPIQAAAAAVFGDEAHVLEQQRRYLRRLERLVAVMEKFGVACEMPSGGLYLWPQVPEAFGRDGGTLAAELASTAGLVVAPGGLFGDRERVRIAATVLDRQLDELGYRFG
ncbi:MAG: aminotransferase class I/II-fold pyridoxal phosphate-dependent enzyme [Ferrimicrobium sp.]